MKGYPKKKEQPTYFEREDAIILSEMELNAEEHRRYVVMKKLLGKNSIILLDDEEIA